MATYEVDIAMSPNTVLGLTNQGLALWVFKTVRCSPGGVPLLWLVDTHLLTNTVIQWSPRFQAFVSNDPIVSGAQVRPSMVSSIELGQTLRPTPDGAIQPNGGGVSGAISIANHGDAPRTVGICELASDFNNYCAVPLPVNATAVFTPAEQLLLMFGSPLPPGTVIATAPTPGILIDMAGSRQRSVSFDLGQGWAWDGGSWAQRIGSGAEIAPLLIL
jgi:hypothetical protein